VQADTTELATRAYVDANAGGGGGITYDTTNAVFTGDFWINGDSIFQFTVTNTTASLSHESNLLAEKTVPGLTLSGVVLEIEPIFQYTRSTIDYIYNDYDIMIAVGIGAIWGLEDQEAIIDLTNASGTTLTDVRITLSVKYTK